jgi:allantoin racemase
MKHVVLINPNTSARTTAMMTQIARAHLSASISIEGVTARTGPPMILDAAALRASEDCVMEIGTSRAAKADGVIVSAFGDPAIARLRAAIRIPAVGICEASMLEASAGGRRFGIATVTPQLVENFGFKAEELGLASAYVGTRLTKGDPEILAADAENLLAALEVAVKHCITDGADAVIIGGGPLGQAAEALQHRFATPIIAPIPSAARLLLARLDAQAETAV